MEQVRIKCAHTEVANGVTSGHEKERSRRGRRRKRWRWTREKRPAEE